MDRKLPKDQEIERLIRRSDAARSCLEGEAVSFKRRLDVPARIRGSLKEHPVGWLLGSLASGLAASLFLRFKPHAPEQKRRGLPLTLLGLTFTAVRPMAKVWLADQVKNYLMRQSTASATFSNPLHPPRSAKPS